MDRFNFALPFLVEEVDDEVGVRMVGERVVDLSDRDDRLEGVGVELNDHKKSSDMYGNICKGKYMKIENDRKR